MSNQDYILGLSGYEGRFAVSLLHGDQIVFAIEEDKLRRFRGLGLRHLHSIGSRAIEEAISTVPGRMAGVALVVYTPPLDADAGASESHRLQVIDFLTRHYGTAPPVSLAEHTAAHVWFERAVHGPLHVLMVGRSRAVYSRHGSSSYDLELDFPVVSFVARCARFLGLEGGRVHHLENIARLGEARFTGSIREILRTRPDFEQLPGSLSAIAGRPPRLFSDELEHVHCDLAASVFEVLKQEIVELIGTIPKANRGEAVALCGGVFQSWRLNDAVAAAFPGTRFDVSFSPGNPACAIGGVLAATATRLSESLVPFLGPEYDRNQVKAVLDNCKARYGFHSGADAMNMACDALELGKMVGWFSGPCEFGYRSLGARSVFANPADAYACDNLTSYLKRRPSYFTYAVAMKDDPDVGVRSPFLSRSTRLPEYFDDSPVRLQTVSERSGVTLYALLDAFEEKTGVPALLNTSLNYFDEPIACTPRDAVKTFYASGLDMLIMEDFVLAKS